MKYEIKIISEEDTVKSKIYDDLDKAIEIAEKIYNDFIDLDFGDEIVVCEENKKDKTYWANGKRLITEIKIGDIVKVVDSGCTYSTYYDFMLQYGTKADCLGWEYGKSPSTNTSTRYEVVNIAGHLAIIKELADYRVPKVYIIHTEGLTHYDH